jgi:hypothetical protein
VGGKVPGEAEKWDDVIRKITSVWTPEVAAEVLAAITKLDLRADAGVGDVPTFDGSKFVPQSPSVRYADVPITEAELKNLHAVRKDLVVAQGAGRVIEPVEITIERLAGTAYSASGNFFEFGYPDGVIGNALLAFNPERLLGSFSGGTRGFVQLTPSVGSNYWANPDTVVNTFDDKENLPFGVALDQAVTGGTGGLIMHVLYRVL